MGKKDKDEIEPNNNRNVPVKKGLTSRGGSGASKGTFVGNKSKVHIHVVADGTHIKINGKSYPFDESDKSSVKGALATLKKQATEKAPGYAECLEWLEKKSK
jgi:hypothetical protein